MPKRIQRKRTAGWRMPANTVYVGRPGRLGNPYVITQDGHDWWVRHVDDPQTNYGLFSTKFHAQLRAVELYREHVAEWSQAAWDATGIRGRDVACWCGPDQPCHADVVLEHVNA